MTTTELIGQLEEILDNHGDIDVDISNVYGSQSIDQVTVEKSESNSSMDRVYVVLS